MRCNEQLDLLPFSSDHRWQRSPGGDLPVRGCVNCGLTPDEWEQTFEKRLEELGQVGVAVFRDAKIQDRDYVTIDVKA